jgi:hypothetical protein
MIVLTLQRSGGGRWMVGWPFREGDRAASYTLPSSEHNDLLAWWKAAGPAGASLDRLRGYPTQGDLLRAVDRAVAREAPPHAFQLVRRPGGGPVRVVRKYGGRSS